MWSLIAFAMVYLVTWALTAWRGSAMSKRTCPRWTAAEDHRLTIM